MQDVNHDPDDAGVPPGLRRVLGVDRRRQLLETLADGGRHTLTSAALAVSADESLCDRQALRTTYLTVYHEDVPALAAAGLVSYDEDTGVLAVTERGRAVADVR